MRNFKEKVAKYMAFSYTAKDKQLFLQVKTMHEIDGPAPSNHNCS
ncbi:hypothetical protein ACEQPO_29730 [Bacillus sp. SL00103]